jgi:hypothetical protein
MGEFIGQAERENPCLMSILFRLFADTPIPPTHRILVSRRGLFSILRILVVTPLNGKWEKDTLKKCAGRKIEFPLVSTPK